MIFREKIFFKKFRFFEKNMLSGVGRSTFQVFFWHQYAKSFLKMYISHSSTTSLIFERSDTAWEETSRKMKCSAVGTMILQIFISQTIDLCKKIIFLTTFFGEMTIWSFCLIKLHVIEMCKSPNEVCEGVAGVKNYTKESCLP